MDIRLPAQRDAVQLLAIDDFGAGLEFLRRADDLEFEPGRSYRLKIARVRKEIERLVQWTMYELLANKRVDLHPLERAGLLFFLLDALFFFVVFFFVAFFFAPGALKCCEAERRVCGCSASHLSS